MNISLNKSIANYPLSSDNKARANNICVSNQSFKGLADYSKNLALRLVEKEGTKKLFKSNMFNGMVKSALNNPGVNEALIALFITCGARPLTIIATPGAKREDKEYAATQSFASGVTGLAFAYIIFNPIQKSFENLLSKVNKNGIKTAINSIYTKRKYKKLVKQLLEFGLIPDKETFTRKLQEVKDFQEKPLDYLKKFMNGEYLKDKNVKSAKAKIAEVLSGSDAGKRAKWISLAEKFSKALTDEFNLVKMNGVEEKSKYLVHHSFEFLKEGTYKLVKSRTADKAGSLYNYAAKFIFFPFTAFVMIYSIPSIMRVLFPNHKKSKKKEKLVNQSSSSQNMSGNMQKKTVGLGSTHVIKKPVFDKIKQKPAMNKQVSFSGNVYNKIYEEPLSRLFSCLAEKIACSKPASNYIKGLLKPAYVEKYGVKVPLRNSAGQIMNRADDNFFLRNIVNIAGIWGSIFYIFNTIRNKEIDPERKPALCTNMAIVALFSAVTSASIEKVSKPFFDTLMKAHKIHMGDKLTYNCEEAWAMLRKIITGTFAFRYLGPVLATPAADKLVKLFHKPKE